MRPAKSIEHNDAHDLIWPTLTPLFLHWPHGIGSGQLDSISHSVRVCFSIILVMAYLSIGRFVYSILSITNQVSS